MASPAYCIIPIPVDSSGSIDVSGILVTTGTGVFMNVNPSMTNLNGSAFYSPTGFLFQVGPIPPPCFFNMNGIYSQRFEMPMQITFDRLYAQQIGLNPALADPFNNRSEFLYVQQMSQSQRRRYIQQIELFQKVYTYNLAAYIYAGKQKKTPIYYQFTSSSELTQFRAASALIDKLYNINLNYPVASLFFLPFPPFCN